MKSISRCVWTFVGVHRPPSVQYMFLEVYYSNNVPGWTNAIPVYRFCFWVNIHSILCETLLLCLTWFLYRHRIRFVARSDVVRHSAHGRPATGAILVLIQVIFMYLGLGVVIGPRFCMSYSAHLSNIYQTGYYYLNSRTSLLNGAKSRRRTLSSGSILYRSCGNLYL